MRLAFLSSTKPRIQSTVYLPSFREASAWATERRLNVLYDSVSERLSTQLPGLRVAGNDQLDVLERIAKEIGLQGFSADRPFTNKEDERFVQRVAWRTAAAWMVLSLLWTLAEGASDEDCSPNEWAAAVPIAERRQELGGSDLPEGDERLALGMAATTLAGCFAEHESALFIRDRCLVIRSTGDVSVAARPVTPLALISTDRSIIDGEVALESDDRVWLASGQPDLPLDGEYDQADELLTMTGDGTLRIENGTALAPVVTDVTLLFERDF